MSKKDPKPEIMRLEELALQVKGGEIKLPRFQRPFVWKQLDMLKLLDSIYKGYPIGSILIWNSSQRLTSERNIAGLEIDENRSDWFPTNYLLDGQQRLTTLCGALFWNGGDHGNLWDIHFDLEKEEFLYPKDANLIQLYPLNKLASTSDFIKQCMKFEHHPRKERYVEVAERLLRALKDYKIAVVKIGDMTIEEVAPIFERINSTGRKLTIVDLMMAATWSSGFDLTARIREIQAKIEGIGFYGVSDQLVLRSIAASAGLGINKDDIQRLRTKKAEELVEAAAAAESGILKALHFLRERIGLHDLAYLPYSLLLTHLAEFFRLCESPTNEQLTGLAEWFWYTSVTGYFSGANTGQNTKDLAMVRSFVQKKASLLPSNRQIDISAYLFDKFNLRNASSTAFALLLVQLRPKKSIDDRALDDSYQTVKSGRMFAAVGEGEYAKINIFKIIHPYAEMLDIDENAMNLESHALNLDCVAALKNRNVLDFVKARANLCVELVSKLTSCEVSYQLVNFNSKSVDIEVDDVGELLDSE